MIVHQPLRTVGLLGDIRTQDERLATAVAYLRSSKVDRILSAGNIVDGPGDLARTCGLLDSPEIHCVRGNHERWLLDNTMRELPDATQLSQVGARQLQFLAALPVVREYSTAAGRMLLCHGLGPDDDVAGNLALQALIAADCYRIVICGHTHRRMVRKVGAPTFINAGLLAGPRAGFARIDFAAREVVYFDLIERDSQLAVEEAERHPL